MVRKIFEEWVLETVREQNDRTGRWAAHIFPKTDHVMAASLLLSAIFCAYRATGNEVPGRGLYG